MELYKSIFKRTADIAVSGRAVTLLTMLTLAAVAALRQQGRRCILLSSTNGQKPEDFTHGSSNKNK